MIALVRTALAGLRARRGRTALAAAGIFAASLVVGTAATVGYGLSTGFDRSARSADLPDVIARFDAERRADVDRRVSALPNLAARSYRLEVKDVGLRAGSRRTPRGVVHVVLGDRSRRGYAIVAGRDLGTRPGEVVIERGLARDWGLRPGDRLGVGRLGTLRVAGVAVSPDNVAYPLSKTARIYVGAAEVNASFGPGEIAANVALLWLNDPERADVTLTQARAVSFGIGRLAFITRPGVQILFDQAAGIVIALLVAFSLVALAAAGTMLTASAHADTQRRLPAIGVQRALGFTPGRIAATHAVEAAVVALPAGALGLAAGVLAVSGPTRALLAALNEEAPGAALLGPLVVLEAAIVALVAAAATWPAWRAARRSPARVLRGGDLVTRPRAAGRRRPDGGLLVLGARFTTATRARWVAAVAVVGACAAVVLLMLALGTLLDRLREDPGTVGKRYQLTTRLEPYLLPSVRALPGVEAAQQRYSLDVADSFRLGEPLRLVAFPGDHTRFEAPPLAEGRRLAGPGEAEVGVGLADALGLRAGSTLAVQAPSGEELRFRVSGVVRALENDGRMAYVRPDRVLAAAPRLSSQIAVRLEPGADRARVSAALRGLGARPERVGGATTSNGAFLGVLATVLRGVGLAVGLVCLYALVQALAMTARERRGALALLRAVGAERRSVVLVLAGAAGAVVIPAAALAVALETLVLGPLVAELAAGYATLPLRPAAAQIALVTGGLAALAALAAALVARRTMREPVVDGLRGE